MVSPAPRDIDKSKGKSSLIPNLIVISLIESPELPVCKANTEILSSASAFPESPSRTSNLNTFGIPKFEKAAGIV